MGTYFGGIAVFLFVRYVTKEQFLRYYGDSLLYMMFVEEVKSNPWTISSASNVLLLPHSVKNCVLPLTEITFMQFAVPKALIYVLTTAIPVLVGTQISDF